MNHQTFLSKFPSFRTVVGYLATLTESSYKLSYNGNSIVSSNLVEKFNSYILNYKSGLKELVMYHDLLTIMCDGNPILKPNHNGKESTHRTERSAMLKVYGASNEKKMTSLKNMGYNKAVIASIVRASKIINMTNTVCYGIEPISNIAIEDELYFAEYVKGYSYKKPYIDMNNPKTVCGLNVLVDDEYIPIYKVLGYTEDSICSVESILCDDVFNDSILSEIEIKNLAANLRDIDEVSYKNKRIRTLGVIYSLEGECYLSIDTDKNYKIRTQKQLEDFILEKLVTQYVKVNPLDLLGK